MKQTSFHIPNDDEYIFFIYHTNYTERIIYQLFFAMKLLFGWESSVYSKSCSSHMVWLIIIIPTKMCQQKKMFVDLIKF